MAEGRIDSNRKVPSLFSEDFAVLEYREAKMRCLESQMICLEIQAIHDDQKATCYDMEKKRCEAKLGSVGNFNGDLFLDDHQGWKVLVAILKIMLESLEYDMGTEKAETEEKIKKLKLEIEKLKADDDEVEMKKMMAEIQRQKQELDHEKAKARDLEDKFVTLENKKNVDDLKRKLEEKETEIRGLSEKIQKRDIEIIDLQQISQDLNKSLREIIAGEEHEIQNLNDNSNYLEKVLKEELDEKDREIRVLKQNIIDEENALKELADEKNRTIQEIQASEALSEKKNREDRSFFSIKKILEYLLE